MFTFGFKRDTNPPGWKASVCFTCRAPSSSRSRRSRSLYVTWHFLSLWHSHLKWHKTSFMWTLLNDMSMIYLIKQSHFNYNSLSHVKHSIHTKSWASFCAFISVWCYSYHDIHERNETFELLRQRDNHDPPGSGNLQHLRAKETRRCRLSVWNNLNNIIQGNNDERNMKANREWATRGRVS